MKAKKEYPLRKHTPIRKGSLLANGGNFWNTHKISPGKLCAVWYNKDSNFL